MTNRAKDHWLMFGVWIILVGLLFVSTGSAQQRDTVYRQITDGSVADPTVAALTAAESIGQIQHLWIVVFTDAPSQTCSDIGEPEFLHEGSFSSSFSPIILPPAKVHTIDDGGSNSRIVTVTSAGAFPFNRLRVMTFDETNCQVDVYYSGTVNPISDYNQGLNIGNTSNIYTLLQNAIDINGTSSQTIGNCGTGISVVVYALTLYNGGSAASDVQLEWTNSDPATFIGLNLDGLCSGCGFVWPNTGGAYLRAGKGLDLDITSSNANGDIGGTILYRCE